MGNNQKIQEVDHYISQLSEEMQSITKSLREIILDVGLDLKEEYKWSMPYYTNNGLVCYLQASKNHVNLGFHKGNELEDKDSHQLLQGSGKTMRHIKIKKKEDIQPGVFTELIKEAADLNAY